jgi:hypothetical protein
LPPKLPGTAAGALFDSLNEMSAAGSRIAAGLGPEPGEIEEFAGNVATISQGDNHPPVAELWYEDPRVDTKDLLARLN